jgi:FtsX-like permease family
MGSLIFVARSQFRRRVRDAIALAVVVGVASGLAASLVAGARRSTTVVDRYFDAAQPYTTNVFALSVSLDEIRRIPGVVRADPSAYVAMTRQGTTDGINGLAIDPSSIDATIRLVAGRHLTSADRDAVCVVNESFVEQFGLGVGDGVDVRTFSEADSDNVAAGDYRPTGPSYQFRIVGVVRPPSDVALDEVHSLAQSTAGTNNGMMLPIAWYDARGDDFLKFGTTYDVQLADATRDRGRFEAAVRASADPGDPVGFGPPRFSERRASLDTPVDVETGVLMTLGVALALATGVVVALLLRAQERGQQPDRPVLTALGITGQGRGLVAALRTAPVAMVGALLTVMIGYLLSGRYPIGIGHMLELHRGRSASVPVLVAAALVVLVVVEGSAYVFGVRGGARIARATSRRSIADGLARVGAPPELVVGTRLAFQRGSPAGPVPTRPAVLGGGVAVALIAAIGVVVTGIEHLYSRPAAHGWAWDAVIGNTNFDLPQPILERALSDDRFAEAVPASYGEVTIGAQSREVLALGRSDDAPPVVLSGRLPASAQEIALGARLARQLHAGIGSRVSFSVAGGELESSTPGKPLDLVVVGIAIAPILGEAELGESAVVSVSAIRAAGGRTNPRFVLARFRPGDREEIFAAIRNDYTAEIMTDAIPARVVNLHRVRQLPLLGAGLAALLSAVLLVYTLAVGVRVRARELGVLRALGLTSRRVGRVLAYQGVLLAIAMLVIGVPVGLLLGTASWRAIAHRLGVADDLHAPLSFLALVPAALAVGVVASWAPSGRVRRRPVAELVRAE